MSDYSVSPEGGFWEEADRPTLSDAIQESVSALNARRGHGFDLLWSGYQDRSIATVGRLAR